MANMHTRGKNKAQRRMTKNRSRSRRFGSKVHKLESNASSLHHDLRKFVPQVAHGFQSTSDALLKCEVVLLLLAKQVTEDVLTPEELTVLEEFVAEHEEEAPDDPAKVQPGEGEPQESDTDQG